MNRIKKMHPNDIERLASALFHVKLEDLKGLSRCKPLPIVRFAIWKVLYSYSKLSLSAIGLRFNRDHTTILHGLQQAGKTEISSMCVDLMANMQEDWIVDNSGDKVGTSVDNLEKTLKKAKVVLEEATAYTHLIQGSGDKPTKLLISPKAV